MEVAQLPQTADGVVTEPVLSERRFRCMTTDIEILLAVQPEAAVEAALDRVEAFFYSFEQRFSRFRPDSELAQLNSSQAEDRGIAVSAELAELVQAALAAASTSGGIFDPTILDALEAAGYDRSIDLIRAEGAVLHPLAARVTPGAWRDFRVQLAPDGWRIWRPQGRRLDLGGIGKGWAADRAAELLVTLGPGVVNAGGDLRAWGDQPGAEPGEGWLVAVDHPLHANTDVTWLSVRDGAAATSSIVSRRWAGGHHLIDPRTGHPADTDLLSVTALAPTVAQAEVAAKVALVLGRDAGLDWLADQDEVQALMAAADGHYYGTPDINDFLYIA